MQIKIIKRALSEKVVKEGPATDHKSVARTNARKVDETIKSWIDELRQKRERERRSFEELFSQ